MSNYISSNIVRDGSCLRVNGRAICSPRDTSDKMLDGIAKFLEQHSDQLLDGLMNSGNQFEVGKQLKQYGYVSKSTHYTT